MIAKSDAKDTIFLKLIYTFSFSRDILSSQASLALTVWSQYAVKKNNRWFKKWFIISTINFKTKDSADV